MLPNLGLETIHPHSPRSRCGSILPESPYPLEHRCRREFPRCLAHRRRLAGYAEAVYGWFSQRPKLQFLGWEEWRKTVPEKEAASTWEHIARSPNASIEKARRLLDYEPALYFLAGGQRGIGLADK